MSLSPSAHLSEAGYDQLVAAYLCDGWDALYPLARSMIWEPLNFWDVIAEVRRRAGENPTEPVRR